VDNSQIIVEEAEFLGQHFKEAEKGGLGNNLSNANPPMEVRSDLDGALHVFTALSSQRTLIEVIDGWLAGGDRQATWTGMHEE
jgi:hypothetical protein